MHHIKLVVLGIGNVPSFKNSKMIARGRLITDPKKQRWMAVAAVVLESRLRSFFRIRGTEIQTEPQALSWIASWIPLDDSVEWIGELCVNWRRVKKGEEGFEMTIEKLPAVGFQSDRATR